MSIKYFESMVSNQRDKLHIFSVYHLLREERLEVVKPPVVPLSVNGKSVFHSEHIDRLSLSSSDKHLEVTIILTKTDRVTTRIYSE